MSAKRFLTSLIDRKFQKAAAPKLLYVDLLPFPRILIVVIELFHSFM